MNKQQTFTTVKEIFKKLYMNIIKMLKTIWKTISKAIISIYANKQTAIGFTIMMTFVLLAIFGPIMFPYDQTTNWSNRYADISLEHWLGTDELGRDIFRQLVFGAKNVLSISLLTAIFTVCIGVTLGIISGFVGGIVDKTIQGITNLFLTIPSFPVLLLLAQLITIEDAVTFALVLSIWNWAGLCRAIRAQIMSLKERDFIQICKVMNMSRTHIIFKELLPNISSYVLVNFVMIMKSAITGSVGIMMLGLAAFEPSNWGAMIHRARVQGLINPDAVAFLIKPLVAVILFQVGSLLFANGLDELLNPRLKVN